MGRRIFVGDIHGHYDGLMQLVDAIALTDEDALHFVGDLIDRGPKSFQVMEYVRQNKHPCVLGNHEHLLLNAFPDHNPNLGAFQSWLHSGGQPTLTSYPDTEKLLDHVEWLKQLPLFIDLGDIFLVHAGLDPTKPLRHQTQIDLCWIRDAFHRSPDPFFADKLVITGHTITFTLPGVKPGEIAQGAGWLDIDTGAYHPKSGWLTAVDVDNELVYQVNTMTQAERTTTLEEATVLVEPTAVRPRRKQVVVR